MSTLDAHLSIEGFNMAKGSLVNFDAYLSSNSSFYEWQTTLPASGPNNYVIANGSGITTDGSGNATGGSITSVQIDLAHDAVTDALITLASPVALTSMLSPSGTDPYAAADKFWEALLSGNDTIYAPDVGSALVFGDFLDIHSSQLVDEEKIGGNDVISANATSEDGGISLGTRGTTSSALVGDAFSVSGEVTNNIAYEGVLTGGDDTISLTGLASYGLIGDAYTVGELGHVFGGDDTIKSDATSALFGGFGSTAVLVGDVFDNDGLLDGGADTITGSNFAFLDEGISGDAWRQTADTTGGKDVIHGRAGHDYIAGDAGAAGGNVTGGADKLYGGEDADIVAGDVLQAGNDGPFGSVVFGGSAVKVNIVGGNDTIRGDQGNDILAGDIYAVAGVTGDSTISGGNDTLLGGDGDDTLYGDFGAGASFLPPSFFANGGNDTLTGGVGNDSQYGESGNDVFIIAAAADSVNEVINGGDGSDRIRFTSTLAGDTLVLSSHVALVEIAEITNANGDATGTTALNINAAHVGYGLTLRGNAGANALTGTGFDDTLNGGGGKDMLNGGGGADRFVYGSAGDSTSTGYDTVKNTDLSAVIWDVQGPIEAIDAKINTGALSTGNFDTQLANAANAAHLGAHHAVLFTPSGGGLAGKTFLIVDQNNLAGYQAGADLVMLLTNPHHLGNLDTSDFI